jgi:site-specific recombinase XerD
MVFGKSPDAIEGYSEDTVYKTAYRCGKFDRWVWKREGGYTMPLTHEHADAYLRDMAYDDYSGSHMANTKDSLKRYFKWRHHEYGGDLLEPELSISKDTNVQQTVDRGAEELRVVRRHGRALANTRGESVQPEVAPPALASSL